MKIGKKKNGMGNEGLVQRLDIDVLVWGFCGGVGLWDGVGWDGMG